ncbi:hypothetical protein IAQ61_011059 [Plenodomus lingam]|uniref:uncharacterized protein n=1 Tax=Leptosphaeria maculans TaxID=5022 RepID=UPI00332CA7B7|nr:hypothetical protein IAQ61_011059 [Plenodomus lingam]
MSTNADTAMGNAPPTPAHDTKDTDLTSPAIDFSPSTVPYNESFENELMNLILHPPPTSTSTSTSPPPSTPPLIPASSLPIPLSSPLRKHPSDLPIPGLHLTHPNGYHTGGPGPSPATIRDFAERVIREHGVEDAGQLERVVEHEVRRRVELVRERMEARAEAVERNRGVERELGDLRLQRSAELRVMERVKGGRR